MPLTLTHVDRKHLNIYEYRGDVLPLYTCFKGRATLGLRNELKIATQGSLCNFFPLSHFFPSSSFRSLFLLKLQFIEALDTCHLSATHRGRSPSASTPGIADVSHGEEIEGRGRKKNTLRHFVVSFARSKHLPEKAGASFVFYRLLSRTNITYER